MSETDLPFVEHPGNKTSDPEFTKSQVICRHCAQPIAQGAKVCHYCSRSQSRFWAFFDRVAILISIALVALAFMQFIEARRERVAADQALAEATDAKDRAELAARKAQEAEHNVTTLNEKLRQQILSMITISYITLESRVAWSVHSQKVAKEIKEEMGSLLAYVIPDSQERSHWMDNLERRVSGK